MHGVLIMFFVDNERFAQRRWHAVPRVGDEVMLGRSAGKKPYRVVRVVFGVEADNALPDQQDVNIELRELKPPAKKKGKDTDA